MTLRTLGFARKQRRATPVETCGPRRVTLGCAAVVTLVVAGCAAPPTRTVALGTLRAAPAQPCENRFAVASDPVGLRALCRPLGERFGVFEIRSRQDWNALLRVVPELGLRLPWSREAVVAIACWDGTPLDGGWPVELRSFRLHEGLGLVSAQFHGGTFMPDGTARVVVAPVPGLRRLLAVEVGGTVYATTP
ncbi:MAG: hypothetical protein IPM18_05260 [Phycisphaerales bacterium]|nr:hypothetical protein [Phycisphaerales bacterium]